MTLPSLSTRDRRSALLGLLAVATILCVFKGLPAFVRWRTTQLSASRSLVQRAASMRALVVEERSLQGALTVGQNALTARDSAFLEGESSTDAASALSSIVSSVARESGAQLGNMQYLPDSSLTATTRVRVRVNVTGDAASVVNMLANLEAGLPLLSIKELSITANEPSSGAPEALQAEVVVEGIMRRRASPVSSSEDE